MDDFQSHSPANPEKTDAAGNSEAQDNEANAAPPATPADARPPDETEQLSLSFQEPAPPAPQPGPGGDWTAYSRPAPDPPWTFGDLIAFVVFAVLSFVFANLVAVSVYSLLRHGDTSSGPMQQTLMQTPWVITMQTGWELLWLLFIYFLVTRKYQRRFWEALKWIKVQRPVVLYLAAGAALAVVAQLIFSLFPSQKHLPVEKLFSSTESAYLLTFFGICVAPFVEELVFRGFFYPVFERLWGLFAAVLLTALLFAAIHVPQLSGGWEEITAIFFVGAVFSYVRGKTGSLVPSFLMHLAYNTALFVSLYFSTDRFRTLKG